MVARRHLSRWLGLPLGSMIAFGTHAAATSSIPAQTPVASPARNPAPRVVASSWGETSTGSSQASARAWRKTEFAHPAIDAKTLHRGTAMVKHT